MSSPDAAESPTSYPDRGKSCLLIIDMINPFTFPDAAKMFPAVLQVAEHIKQFKQ